MAETVQALNFLDGHTWDPTCRPSQAQNAALEAILREVELSPLPLDGSSPEADLQELLGPLSSYSGEHVAQAALRARLGRFQKLQRVATLRRSLRDQIVIAS